MPYEIESIELPLEFEQLWACAARHLQAIAQHELAWLRAHLHQPMAEHLSFRVGNQLFFVFVELPGLMDFREREQRLLAMVADEAGGVPCVMRMRQRDGTFVPARPDWGLVHARTGEIVVPPQLVNADLIEMTEWEIHDFGLQVVLMQLKGQQKEVQSWQPSRHINPSIWFVDDDELNWVMVRTARAPRTSAERPATLASFAKSMQERQRCRGNFASVVVANADTSTDRPLYRGHPLTAQFEALEPV